MLIRVFSSAAAVCAAAALAGCGQQHPGQRRTGHALRGDGPQDTGPMSSTIVRIGGYYRYAFPVLINDSRKPVTLDSAGVDTVGRGVEIVGYPVYNVADTNWAVVDAIDEVNPGTPNIIPASRYAVAGIVIKPGEQSQFIVTVRVRVTAANPGSIHGCVIRYHSGSTLYQQKFSCWFAFGEYDPATTR